MGKFPNSEYGCFLKWWYPQNTPKWSFLVGKTHGCWVPPFLGTPLCRKNKHDFLLGLRGVPRGVQLMVFLEEFSDKPLLRGSRGRPKLWRVQSPSEFSQPCDPARCFIFQQCLCAAKPLDGEFKEIREEKYIQYIRSIWFGVAWCNSHIQLNYKSLVNLVYLQLYLCSLWCK